MDDERDFDADGEPTGPPPFRRDVSVHLPALSLFLVALGWGLLVLGGITPEEVGERHVPSFLGVVCATGGFVLAFTALVRIVFLARDSHGTLFAWLALAAGVWPAYLAFGLLRVLADVLFR